MGKNKEYTEIDANLLHTTEKAYLIEDGKGKQVWIAKSLCKDFEIDRAMAASPECMEVPCTLTIPVWLAEDTELI